MKREIFFAIQTRLLASAQPFPDNRSRLMAKKFPFIPPPPEAGVGWIHIYSPADNGESK